ncbi:hypothetical protein FBBNIHIM_05325 [Pseudocitrobacter vendiensis]|uniref:Uncharacterized protein n=1 Tax=Pseudocitrobacter vendiensis TaxID=2488306 RepID=A0ABM9F649_9ENTR|nr:hypothetical protein FBBNIHIM_05325 [Pseudocitrobacter vendiensis]
MAIRFRPTEYVITADGEWVAVDALSYQHTKPLLCGSCHTPATVTQGDNGWQLVHRPRSEADRRRVIRCCYRPPTFSTGIRGL